jgi:ABC-type multidrug transport system fused ATPase/permease subunit
VETWQQLSAWSSLFTKSLFTLVFSIPENLSQTTGHKAEEQQTMRSNKECPSDGKWLLQRLRAFWKLQLLGIACVAVASILSLLDPLLMKWLIDSVLPHKNLAYLGLVVAGALGAYSGRVLFQNWATLCTFGVGQKLALKLRIELFVHLERMTARFYKDNAIGDLVQRLDRDVDVICEQGTDLVPALLRMVLVLALVILTMFTLSWRLAAPLLPLLPLFLLVRYRFRGPLQRAADEVREVAGQQSNVLTEFLGAMVQIQLLRCERQIARRYTRGLANTIRAVSRRRVTEMEFSFVSMLVVTTGGMTILGYGGYLAIQGLLTVGGLVAFYSYVLRLFEPLSTAIELFARLHRIRASLRRLRALRNVDPEVKDLADAVPLEPNPRYHLSYRNVSFSYEAGLPTIEDATLWIRSGEVIFLVGPSGSGKSTLFRLLCRLHDVANGSINLNGTDIRRITLASLRSSISAVPQEPVLFAVSLRDNLLLASPGATEEQLFSAAKAACLHDVIERLPRGWDEMLGPLGSRLSGGERQRVALARALLQERPILALDEATSALDAQTEARVLGNIRDYASDRMLLIVSHRLASAPLADRVVVVEQGRIVEQGSHSELLRKDGRYAALWKHEKQRTTDAEREVFSTITARQSWAATD